MSVKKMHPSPATSATTLCARTDVVRDPLGPLHATAWALVGAAVFAMLCPVVFLRGMSLDGITYATIARNMAVGLGDFWHPFYTATLHHPYYESPTLAFWIQSWFFRALGDQWWVERLYSVFTAVPTAALIVLIWRRLLRHDPRLQRFAWLPLALWIVMPSWFWIYRHNYLENTLAMFAALAVYASLRAMEDTRWWPGWTLLAAAGISAALLTKGPVGLFPLVTPAIAWLTLRRQSIRRSLAVQLFLAACLAGVLGLVCSQNEARAFLSKYLERQVLASLQGQRDTVDSPLGRWQLAWDLPVDLVASTAVAAALVLWVRIGRREKGKQGRNLRGPVTFALLTALSASIPIMLSPKQSAYYAAPSWPFYAMTLALSCLPAVTALSDRRAGNAAFDRSLSRLRVAAAGIALLTIVVSLRAQGATFRDAELIDDVERIGQIVGKHGRIRIDPDMEEEWSLHAYLYRKHYISLSAADELSEYCLQPVERPWREVEGYQRADAGLNLFRLYRRKDVASVPAAAARAR